MGCQEIRDQEPPRPSKRHQVVGTQMLPLQRSFASRFRQGQVLHSDVDADRTRRRGDRSEPPWPQPPEASHRIRLRTRQHLQGAMKISSNQSVFLHAVSTAILESRERSYRSVPDCRDTQVDFIRAKVMPVPELETATAVESPWLPVHQLRLSEHLRNTGGRSGVESSSQPFAPSIVSGVRRTCWHTQCSLSFVFDCRLPLTNRAAAW
jgi:hypothetical protein